MGQPFALGRRKKPVEFQQSWIFQAVKWTIQTQGTLWHHQLTYPFSHTGKISGYQEIMQSLWDMDPYVYFLFGSISLKVQVFKKIAAKFKCKAIQYTSTGLWRPGMHWFVVDLWIDAYLQNYKWVYTYKVKAKKEETFWIRQAKYYMCWIIILKEILIFRLE